MGAAGERGRAARPDVRRAARDARREAPARGAPRGAVAPRGAPDARGSRRALCGNKVELGRRRGRRGKRNRDRDEGPGERARRVRGRRDHRPGVLRALEPVVRARAVRGWGFRGQGCGGSRSRLGGCRRRAQDFRQRARPARVATRPVRLGHEDAAAERARVHVRRRQGLVRSPGRFAGGDREGRSGRTRRRRGGSLALRGSRRSDPRAGVLPGCEVHAPRG